MRSVPLQQLVRWRFMAWLLAMVLMLGVFAWRVLPALRVESDILALLPRASNDVAINAAVDRFSSALSAKLVILVGAAELDKAKRAADAYASVLSKQPVFTAITAQQRGYSDALWSLYQSHRSYLLSANHAQLLAAGQGEQLRMQALRSAYTPTGLMRVTPFAQDPLGLGNEYLLQQLPATGAARLDGEYLVVSDQQNSYVLLTMELAGSAFTTEIQEQASAALADAQRAAQDAIAPATLTVLTSGAMQHAQAARERATEEMTTFGTIETVLVMGLLIAVFSATRPLLLGALAMALAFVAGVCATHLTFGVVHVLTLVFGSSLIGGVVDYSIHFFADRFRLEHGWTPAAAVEHVGGSVLLGMATTLLGYVVLLLVPFPGLKQIAVFCTVGLAVGAATVLCAYPVLYRAPTKRAAWGLAIGAWLAQQFQSWHWSRLRIVLVSLVTLAVLAGLLRLTVQDDVRTLQASPAALVAMEKQVSALLQTGIESRYFLVRGADAQQLLQRERELTTLLGQWVNDGKLRGFMAISRAVPPLSEQQQAHALLQAQVAAPHGLLPTMLQQLGYAESAAQQMAEQFATGDQPLTPEAYLQSPAATPYRDLWLGQIDSQFASIVTLSGVTDVAALSAGNAVPGVQLVDRVSAISAVLRSYRQAMSWLLCAVYVAAMLMLSSKFGWREVPMLLLPSALASGLTLGLFGWLGVPMNLFTLLALWLVLGLGVDYGIFLRHGRTAIATAALSVTLSAITTLLAFGMLALSATPFIYSIGLTLLLAISLSWLLAMTSCLSRSRYGLPV